jgi:hypothetical protein
VRALSPLWFVVTKPIKEEYIFITLKIIKVRKHFITIDRVARERKCEDREKRKNFVTPTLNVSRKFSMCIIFSSGYIKIYNKQL